MHAGKQEVFSWNRDWGQGWYLPVDTVLTLYS